jgi:hypothetical protein
MKTPVIRTMAVALSLAALFLAACKTAGAGGSVDGTTIRVGAAP